MHLTATQEAGEMARGPEGKVVLREMGTVAKPHSQHAGAQPKPETSIGDKVVSKKEGSLLGFLKLIH